jgi:hypothetical protein
MTISESIADYDISKSMDQILLDLKTKFGTNYLNQEEFVSNMETNFGSTPISILVLPLNGCLQNLLI